jgi:hypothetical protein
MRLGYLHYLYIYIYISVMSVPSTEELEFDSRKGQEFSHSISSSLSPGPTQHSGRWLSGALPQRNIKWPGRETNHSPTTSAQVKNMRCIKFSLLYVLMTKCLVKHKYNFIRFDVSKAVTMKNVIFCYTKTQFVPHRKHITSPPLGPAS